MNSPILTVLICTHDRQSLLSRVLESLNVAHRPVPGVQVLVVANNCRDGTHGLLDDYVARQGNRLPLRWIAEPIPGKSHALNRALPRVDTPLVALVDDDHRVDEQFLVQICNAAERHPEVDLFCGRILPDWDGTEPAWVHDQGPFRIYPLPVPRFDLGTTGGRLTPDRAVPGGGNLFLRASWLARIGEFAVDMGPTGHDLGGAEDLDWVLRGFRLGARMQYVPDVVQYHFVDPQRLTLHYLLRKAYKRTASAISIESPSVESGVPRYIYRKIAGYALRAATAVSTDERRFYLVRSAAAFGEFAGFFRSKRERTRHPTSTPTPP